MRTDGSDGRPKRGGWIEFDIGRPPPKGLDWDRKPDGLTIFIRKGAIFGFGYVILGALLTLVMGVMFIISMIDPSPDKLYEFLFWRLPGYVVWVISTLGLALLTLRFVWMNLHQRRINVTRDHLRLYVEAPSGKNLDEKTLRLADIKEVRVANPDLPYQRSDCLKIVTDKQTYYTGQNLSKESLDWLTNCVVAAIKMAADGAEGRYPDKFALESPRVEREGKIRRNTIELIIIWTTAWLALVLFLYWNDDMKLIEAIEFGLFVSPGFVLGCIFHYFFPDAW